MHLICIIFASDKLWSRLRTDHVVFIIGFVWSESLCDSLWFFFLSFFLFSSFLLSFLLPSLSFFLALFSLSHFFNSALAFMVSLSCYLASLLVFLQNILPALSAYIYSPLPAFPSSPRTSSSSPLLFILILHFPLFLFWQNKQR